VPSLSPPPPPPSITPPRIRAVRHWAVEEYWRRAKAVLGRSRPRIDTRMTRLTHPQGAPREISEILRQRIPGWSEVQGYIIKPVAAAMCCRHSLPASVGWGAARNAARMPLIFPPTPPSYLAPLPRRRNRVRRSKSPSSAQIGAQAGKTRHKLIPYRSRNCGNCARQHNDSLMDRADN
jgi:hypothetical protein